MRCALLDLIVKSGIADAINSLPDGIKSNRDAIAETIENNVRSKIIKEHLNDPAFYDKMSALLNEIIAARKAKAIEYEEYLKRIAELAVKVQAGQAENTPAKLNTPGQARPLQQPQSQRSRWPSRSTKPSSTRGPMAGAGFRRGSRSSRRLCTASCKDVAEVERIFLIIKAADENTDGHASSAG